MDARYTAGVMRSVAAWLVFAVSFMDVGGPARAQEEEQPASAAGVELPPGAPPPKERAAREVWLRTRIDALIAARPELASAHLGVAVVDASSGKKLYDRNGSQRLKLASNAKIITATAALSLLGPEYRFRTTFYAETPKPDGTIAGNLWLRGSGDPSLDTASLWALSRELRLMGVTKVTGGLVIDDSAFDQAVLPPVYDEKKEDAYFRAPVSAASVNDSTVTVWVQPGATAGAAAKVTLDPMSDYFMVTSTATTVASGRNALAVAATPVPGEAHMQITVSGTIRVDDTGGEAVRKRVEHPTEYLGATLKAILLNAGIRIGDKTVRRGVVPPAAKPLASRRSQPVGVLVREMAKTSNNFMAEDLLKTIALEAAGAPASWAAGVAAVKHRLSELGIPEDSYDYRNGSGLYSGAFASPETVARILVAAARDFRYGPDFVAALAVAGADGTLGHRMAGGAAERYVRGKSGSLKGVACLSGLAGGVNRPLLAFSVLVNDAPDTPAGAKAARSLADQVAEHLVLFLEAD